MPGEKNLPILEKKTLQVARQTDSALVNNTASQAPQTDDDETDDFGRRIKSQDEAEEDRADSRRAMQQDRYDHE